MSRKILNAAQLKELDAYTVREAGITSAALMEQAATKVVEEICKRRAPEKNVVVFAGPGNNGGDALAVARLLSEKGFSKTDVYLFNTGKGLSADCELNRNRLAACHGVTLTEVTAQFEPPALDAETLVVDGLFGTGLNQPLRGGFAALVKFINASKADVVSIDMPSGLMCEDNSYNVRAHIVRATLTLTFQVPKLAQLLADNQEFIGQLKILDIGLSAQKLGETETPYEITSEADVAPLLKPRNPFGHKGTFGHALLVAGRHGMAGAAVLAAKACLRSGVGKVTVRTPKSNNDILQIAVPEAVLSLDAHAEHLSAPIDAEPYDALAIGPGIGTHAETAVAFIEQVRHARIPVLIDADGLNILSEHKGWLQQIPNDAVLTPHPLEFRRLGTRSVDSYSTLSEAMELAQRHSLYIILKGHFTAVCTPEGKAYFNPTGNSGMATAGSGDVLSGIVAALLSQKLSVLDACRLGTYLHGLAGDIAADRLGQESLTASDIIGALPDAFRKLCAVRDELKQN